MRFISISIISFLQLFVTLSLRAETLCGRFVTPNQITWTTSEKRTLCGSGDTPTWQNIPFNQAEFFFRSFLQSRGYHNPSFEKKDEKLIVRTGKLTEISRLRPLPERADLDLEKYWFPIGRPLTPDQLNDIEKWFTFKLGRLGYACPKLSMSADKETGEVLIQYEAGEHWTIEEIEGASIPQVEDGVLDRYRAFAVGDAYDPILLELSTNRLKDSQTVINTQYSPECAKKPSGTLRQTTLPGEPRLVTFGFGFDSENLATIRGSWRNSRLSRNASILDISGSLSYRQQTFLASYDWYYLKNPGRHYLKNYIKAERDFEPTYETRSIKTVTAPAYQMDIGSVKADMYAGPSLQFESTQRGEAPNATRLLTLDLGLNIQDHLYEYFLANPQTGYQANFFGSYSNKSTISDVSLAHYKIDFTYLWNVFNFDPTIWVLGFRGSFATTQPGKGTRPDEVPASFKQFLGGSTDMRGFARKNLPSEGTGSLTKEYLGIELRLNNKLPWNLQPLAFIDTGKLGNEAFRVEPTLFYSPGIGLRWQSPIGTLRLSAAHGYVENDKLNIYGDRTKMQYYFSLGEQF
ncbi:MAG: BamA/TamA family outer membrane protein [Chitinophagaceae bacterium]|nr:BamA/TamA family outer membrane protein [Oligoflexus sp.]